MTDDGFRCIGALVVALVVLGPPLYFLIYLPIVLLFAVFGVELPVWLPGD